MRHTGLAKAVGDRARGHSGGRDEDGKSSLATHQIGARIDLRDFVQTDGAGEKDAFD